MSNRLRLPAVARLAAVSALGLLAVPHADAKEEAGPKLTIKIRTDRADALYSRGDTVVFTIAVSKDRKPATGNVAARLTLDGGKELRKETLDLTNGEATISSTLETPGFLLCSATFKQQKKRVSGFAGAAFDPTRIKATTQYPDDFESFWKTGREKLAQIPIDTQIRKLEKHCDANQDAYAVSFAAINNTRTFGFLCVPKRQKPPFPAWITVPGAGPGPFGPSGKNYAAKGALALTVGVHAYDVGTLSTEEIKKAYAELNANLTYSHHGAPDPEAYYFRRAILGIDRAISWLAEREDFDREHLVIDGSSQGGAMALILAGLNKNITAAAANVPAMCDHTAYLQDRAPGWPKLVGRVPPDQRTPFARMVPYFDAVNFARRIDCPVIASAGFIDRTCPPGSVYAAFNMIKTPKRIFNGPANGHEWTVGEYRAFVGKWVLGQLDIGPRIAPIATPEN